MSKRSRPPSRTGSKFRDAARCGIILGLCILSPGQTPVTEGASASARSPAVLSVRQGASSQSIRPLEPGAVIERELVGGGPHLYQLTLAAGEYARITIEPRGIELLTSIIAPSGDKLYQIDNFYTRTVSVIAEQAAGYRVEVQATKANLKAIRYSIKIEEKRAVKSEDQKRLIAERMMNEGVHQFKKGGGDDYRRALESFREVLQLWRALADQQEEIATLFMIGRSHQGIREWEPAAAQYRLALALSQKIGDRNWQVRLLTALGQTYLGRDEKQRAIDFYTQAVAISQAAGGGGRISRGLTDLGLIYYELGDLNRAHDLLKHASQSNPTAFNLAYLASVQKTQGDRTSALENYHQALRLAVETGEHYLECEVRNYLGRLYTEMGQLEAASDHLRQALVSAQRRKAPTEEAVTLVNLGNLYEQMNNLPEAARCYQQAILLCREKNLPDTEANAHSRIAHVERAQGSLTEARANIERALHIRDAMRTTVMSPNLRATYVASYREDYEFCVDLLMQMHRLEPEAGHAAAALAVSERSHVRSLTEMLIGAGADFDRGADQALARRAREVERRIEAKATEQLRLRKDRAGTEQKENLKRELTLLMNEYESVLAQTGAEGPRPATPPAPLPKTLAEVQRLLDPDMLLLEYVLGKERSWLFAVTPQALHTFELPARDQIEKTAGTLYRLLTARAQHMKFEMEAERARREARADRESLQVAAELSRTLLGPVKELLGKKRLLVVTDGALHYLPFAALPEPESVRVEDKENPQSAIRNPQSSMPLVVNHEVVYLLSATTLDVQRRQLAGRASVPKTLAVFADPVFDKNDERLLPVVARSKGGHRRDGQPTIGKRLQAANQNISLRKGRQVLRGEITESSPGDFGFREMMSLLPRLPGSRREADAILALTAKSEHKVAIGFDANQTNAVSPDLSQYRYLHFATHGLLDHEHPALSALALSAIDQRGGEQDGFLRAMEVFKLRLPAELVVLSGCGTGLGREIKGEGLIGMARPFLYAGAARVIVSMWGVDDQATAELMKRFYRELLLNKQRPAAALRTAQISMWRERQWQAPFYWAAFVQQGEPR